MSEKFRLPLVDQRMKPEAAPSAEKERRIELKIARAFIKNRFPLSKDGEALRKKLESAVQEYEHGNTKPLEQLKGHVPTVEHPRLELFQNFDLTKEQKLLTFGPQLSCVQVAKGCRHQCEHCAVSARKNVEYMPFAAVLKIAEELKESEGKDTKLIEEWKTKVTDFLINGPLNNEWKLLKQEYAKHSKLPDDDFAVLKMLCRRNEQTVFQFVEAIRAQFKDDVALLEGAGILRPYINRQEMSTNVSGDYIIPWPLRDTKPGLVHYWDSDPFDYRDTTFLHEDGTPADYGDVFLAHMSVTKDIGITTAGWPKNDTVSQRAAEKIVSAIRPLEEKREELFRKGGGSFSGEGPRWDHVRVSIHPFERGISRGDMSRYSEDMENVVRTLEAIKPEFVFIKSDDEALQTQFVHEVVSPLMERIRDLPYASKEFEAKVTGKSKISGHEKWTSVSHFSGRSKKESTEEQWDVMACMEGNHIRPDGSVEKQEACLIHFGPKDENAYWAVPQGARPKPLGLSLYRIGRSREVK